MAQAGPLGDRWATLRREGAALAESVAEGADAFAGYLEESASHGDSERTLRAAARERAIAAIERRNAAKLRAGDGPLRLETLPGLPL